MKLIGEFQCSCVFILENKNNKRTIKKSMSLYCLNYLGYQESYGDQANLAFVNVILVTPQVRIHVKVFRRN